jgi:proline iminopeptidase
VNETVAVDGADLWTETSGSGPAVALLHGGPGLSDNLGSLASLFDDLATVHRYDQRGGGRSTGDPPFTVDRFVEDLDALRGHWGHPSWTVAGHSWGGWLALLYAIRFPSRVRGLIAIGTPPPPSDDWQPGYRVARSARLSEEERAFFEDVRARRHAGASIAPDEERRWAHLSWRMDFADPASTPDFDREPLIAFPPNYEVNRALNDEMDRWAESVEVLRELASIEAPALLVHGSGDPRPAASSVAAALPHGRLVTIEAAGHFPWMEQPEEVAAVIRPFLAELP